ncbi:MAG: RHS repeat protein, partial [Candidatus Omnitrophica bacterium]|nr:RHS repeat protein [Candidatus Omnitrophota bacterium]
MAVQQRSYDSSGNLLSKTVNTWGFQEITPGRNFVFLKRKDNFVFDGDGSGRRTAEEFFYEEAAQFGNLTKALQLGEVDFNTGEDLFGDERSVESSYVNNAADGNWLVGLPRETVVKDDTGSIVRKTWFYYDNNGNTIPPVKGLLTKKEDWAGDEPEAVNPVTLYTYDEIGNLLTTADPLGNETAITYDAAYNIFPVTVTNALNHQVHNEYYGVDGVALDSGDGYTGLWGQIKSTTDPNEQVGKRAYNVLGRLIATVSPLDSIEFPTQTTDTEFFSDYIKVTARRRINHGQVEMGEAVTFSDGLGRAIQAKSISGKAEEYIINGQVEYNSRGLPERQYLGYFTSNGLSVMDPLDSGKPHITLEYDSTGRAVKAINSDGSYSSTVYDDWRTVSINENGHKQESDFDAYGRLIEKREYLGADGRGAPTYPQTPFTLYAVTKYTYDSEGNLTMTQDAKGNVTTITYDNLGRKVSMDDPDMGEWFYKYDLNGNLIKQIDAKGQIINFTYDGLNRLVNKTDGGALNVNYAYDDPFMNHSKGRLNTAEYGLDETRFGYDSIGREIESIKKINSQSFGVRRNYDALNNLIDIQYPDQEKIFYKYNDAGQIERIGNDAGILNDQQSFNWNRQNFKERLESEMFLTNEFKAFMKISGSILQALNPFHVKEAYAETVELVTLEAKDMPVKTTGGACSGGWNIWSNGYIEGPVSFPDAAVYEFEIIARGS